MNFIENKSLPLITTQPEFYEKNNFVQAISSNKEVIPRRDIVAVVVPHHLLASTYIARMFKLASGRPIDTVVVIGPNHDNLGVESIATAQASWETVEGNLPTDQNLVQKFINDFKISSTPEVFKEEHSVGALAPFVSHYFPGARLLPIILSSHTNESTAEKIGRWLARNLSERSLVIFSTDFSHYLTEEMAHQNDLVTERLIKQSDLYAISRLGNGYVDSPASLIISLVYASEKKIITSIIAKGNSNDFSLKKLGSTTSYMAVIFSYQPN